MRYYKGSREVSFTPGDVVYVRDYKNPAKPSWRKAVIKKKLG